MINTLHSLQQHLQVNAGETNLALNRGQRHYDAQEKAQGYLLVCNYFQSGYIVLYMHVWQEFGPTHSDYDCCRYGLCYYVDKGSHLWLLHETAVSSHTHTLTHRAQCLPQTSLHVSGWTVQWYGYINATLEQTCLKLDTWCRYHKSCLCG